MVGNQCEIRWLFLEPLKSERHPASPLINDGQEKSNFSMKIASAINKMFLN